MSRFVWLLTVGLVGAANAQGQPAEAGPTEASPAGAAPDDAGDAALALPAEPETGGWGAALIARYYEGIQQQPAEAELAQARHSVEQLLLGGVSPQRIEAAVARALFLHVPGRAVPFHIAVPLRIEGDAPALVTDGALLGGRADPLEPAVSQALTERRELLERRRARQRLYDQWRDRTRAQRTLLTAGIPATTAGYVLGYVGAIARYNQGMDTPAVAWTAAIPLVGGPIHLGLTGDPMLIGPMALQLGGWAAVIPGLALKNRWPYDDDPQALVVPFPGGVAVAGRF